MHNNQTAGEIAPDALRATIPFVDDFIHLNSAAGSLSDQSVIDAIHGHLLREARMGNTEARLAVAPEMGRLRAGLARLSNVPEERIALADSHTSAWQDAFQALPLAEGDRILVAGTEWGGNLSAIWQRCRRSGCLMEVIPSTADGCLDPDALAAMLDARVALVCVTLVPAVNGLVNPLEDVAAALADHPAWLFVDAAQSFANVGLDLSHPRPDLVTVSARKFLRAPRGSGFAAYSRRFIETVEPLGFDQVSAPWGEAAPAPVQTAAKFEFAETSFAVRMGVLAAVDHALSRYSAADMARIAALAAHAREGLAGLAKVTVEDRAARLSGLVTFRHADLTPAAMLAALARARINIAAPGAAYAPLWFAGGRPEIARVSPHAFNTHAEVDRMIAAVAAL